MRFFLLLLVVASAALFPPTIAAADSTKSIELHANVVDFYSEPLRHHRRRPRGAAQLSDGRS